MTTRPIPPAIAKIAPDGNLALRQKRHFFIEMVLRRQKPGTGSGLEFLMQRTADNPWPDLREILKGIDWVTIGSVATRAYMPEQMTQDLDVLIRRIDSKGVMERLTKSGYTLSSKRTVSGCMFRSPEGVELDVMFGKFAWLGDALTHIRRDPAGYPVLDLPYLVLMKMSAPRLRDWGDIPRMLGLANEDELNRVREGIACYSPEDSGDLESFILMGKKELEIPPESTMRANP